MEFYIFVYKACAVSLYTILVREVDGRFVTLFFNMSQNDLKRPNRILLIFSAIHIKSLAFRFATPKSPAQIILRWHIQGDFSVIPGASNLDYIKENIAIFRFRTE